MSPRKRPRKRPRKDKRKQERAEEEQRAEDERAEDEEGEEGEEERLSSGQRYALLVSVLVILGVGVIFIDVILGWVMGLLGRQ
jgi:hypothetical protein